MRKCIVLQAAAGSVDLPQPTQALCVFVGLQGFHGPARRSEFCVANLESSSRCKYTNSFFRNLYHHASETIRARSALFEKACTLGARETPRQSVKRIARLVREPPRGSKDPNMMVLGSKKHDRNGIWDL